MRKWQTLYNRNTPRIYQYGSLPGTNGNYFSTPDSVANSITSDIDIRLRVAANDWTPAADGFFVSKLQTAGQFAYDFFFQSAGAILVFRRSTDGTAIRTAGSTASPSASDGDIRGVRVTYSTSTGDIKFYTSLDYVTWTQLGSTSAGAGGAIFDGNTQLAVGAQGSGNTAFPGKIYQCQIYNGIDGTLAVNFNPNNWTTGTTWPAQITGETWTINGTATVVRR
jgi:hypothetical protein